jgi:hypothetical protein
MGMLRVYVTSPQTNLPAGFLWAEFEPEIFAAEEKSLNESLKKLEDQEKMQWEIEYPRKKILVQQQIEEAENQAKLMRMLSTNAELAQAVFSMGTNYGNPMKPDALAKSELNLHLLKQSLAYLETTNFAAWGSTSPANGQTGNAAVLIFSGGSNRHDSPCRSQES